MVVVPANATSAACVAMVTAMSICIIAAATAASLVITAVIPVTTDAEEEEEGEKNTMQKIKEAGTAGLISYIFWEWAFWGISEAPRGGLWGSRWAFKAS